MFPCSPQPSRNTSPLDRANDWLGVVSATSVACFDDLGAPTYDEFEFTRRSFLDRLAAEARANGHEPVARDVADRG